MKRRTRMGLALALARRAAAVAVARAGALLVCLLVLASAGCGMRPLGTNDVTLAYRVSAPSPAPARGEDSATLVGLVRTRLSAAQITADVAAREAGGVEVTVDRDSAGTVDELLAWRGGLTVHDVVTSATPVEGPIDDIATATRDTKAARGERVLLERIDDERARTRVVKAEPRVDLSDGIASVTSPDGRTLVVHLTASGASRVEEAMRAVGAAPVAIVRDHVVLAVAPLAGDPLVLSFGTELPAYARARAIRLLLATPALPPLARVTVKAVPPDVPLAVASLAVPFALSIAWLFFVRRFDRAHPEPWPLVAATFALGGLSVIPAALLEVGWTRLSPWLDPSLVTMGGRLAALPIALPVFALVIGLSEEGAKFLGAWSLAFHRREFDEPVDGLVYGAASALGFAAVENVKYFALGRFGAVLVVIRTFLSIPAHLFFGAIWGYALGRTLIVPRTRVLLYVAAAALAHGAFDTFLSLDGTATFALLLNLVLASLFVVFLRRSLRHGVVSEATARVDPAKRFIVPVGSPWGFAGSVAALHVIASLVFFGSTLADQDHRRVDLPLYGAMTVLVLMLGVAAWALSRTMPLDVVLDTHGVTFAGAARAWRSIRSVERTPRGIRVRSTEGDMWIGPAPGATLEPLARSIAARIEVRGSSP